MDSSKCCLHRFLVFLFLLFLMYSSLVLVSAQPQEAAAASLQLMSDAVEWPMSMSSSSSSLYDGADELGGDDEDIDGRRSLFWHRVYYISYGALSANRIPCPPRSGRSYYTHNCYFAQGPVHPYTRGCSAITRCRR